MGCYSCVRMFSLDPLTHDAKAFRLRSNMASVHFRNGFLGLERWLSC